MENPFIQIKEIEKVRNLCSKLVDRVVDRKPGISENDDLWLSEERSNYKTYLSLLRKQRNLEPLPKKKLADLTEKGIPLGSISEDQAFVTFELLDALSASFNLIKMTDAKGNRDRLNQGLDHARTGTLANIEFADFFLKVSDRFNLSEGETLGLYGNIFESSGLQDEFKTKGLSHFPGGLKALIRTFLHLRRELAGWRFVTPNEEQDLNDGVDLIAVSPNSDEFRYYGIKGRIDSKGILVDEITSQDQYQKRVNAISGKNSSDTNSKESSLERIFGYVKGLRGSVNAKAFYVEAPSS